MPVCPGGTGREGGPCGWITPAPAVRPPSRLAASVQTRQVARLRPCAGQQLQQRVNSAHASSSGRAADLAAPSVLIVRLVCAAPVTAAQAARCCHHSTHQVGPEAGRARAYPDAPTGAPSDFIGGLWVHTWPGGRDSSGAAAWRCLLRPPPPPPPGPPWRAPPGPPLAKTARARGGRTRQLQPECLHRLCQAAAWPAGLGAEVSRRSPHRPRPAACTHKNLAPQSARAAASTQQQRLQAPGAMFNQLALLQPARTRTAGPHQGMERGDAPPPGRESQQDNLKVCGCAKPACGSCPCCCWGCYLW